MIDEIIDKYNMRHYINLVESASTIVKLYRGDANHIETFELSKTDKSALFGRGIYLTDSPVVAGDYTIKGGDETIHKALGDDQYKTQKDAIAGYIMSVIHKELDWTKVRDEIKDKWQTHFFQTGESVQEDYSDDLRQTYRNLVMKAKTLYQERAKDFRIFKDSSGEWIITRKDRAGVVSSFDIPAAYLAKTLHGDRPLDDRSMAVVRKFILANAPQGMDVRDSNNQIIWDFDEWLNIFKTKGSRYAWRGKDGLDPLIGGKGVYPSLDEIWHGQHGGYALFNRVEDFIPTMQAAGYTGIEYDGGVRMGSNVRGLGGVRHQSYVLWDDTFVSSCRTETSAVVDDEMIPDAMKRVQAPAMFNRHLRKDDRYGF